MLEVDNLLVKCWNRRAAEDMEFVDKIVPANKLCFALLLDWCIVEHIGMVGYNYCSAENLES